MFYETTTVVEAIKNQMVDQDLRFGGWFLQGGCYIPEYL